MIKNNTSQSEFCSCTYSNSMSQPFNFVLNLIEANGKKLWACYKIFIHFSVENEVEHSPVCFMNNYLSIIILLVFSQ
jgi:hypothetical protein